jgi:actin-related protein 8
MVVDSASNSVTDHFLNCLLNIEQETLKKLARLEKLKGKKLPTVGPPTKTFNQKIYDKTNYLTELAERKNFEQQPGSTAVFKKASAISHDPNEDISDNIFKWTSVSEKPSYLVGREALTISETEKYLLRHPIKYGFFNNEYSFQSVCDDVHKIVDFCVNSVLQIKRKDYEKYNVVLIIPDLFVRTQVKGLINVFMRVMGFKSIFIHQESVLSSFGAALQSACVVDVGSSKVSVCCLEDGLIVENSLIRKNFGGDDITKLLHKTLGRKNSTFYFPIENFNIENPYHFRILERMKEVECEIPNIQNPQAQFIPKNVKIWQHRKNSNTKIINSTVCEAIYTSPLGLFYPDIFNSIKQITIPNLDQFNDIYNEIFTDNEDTMDELIKSNVNN